MRTLVSLATLVLVLLLVLADVENVSPGPLAPPHEAEASLTSSGGCVACHGEEGRTMADACLACHAGVAADIELARGLHGRLVVAPTVDACARCHTEHLGAAGGLAGARSFAAAGIADVQAFAHEGLGWTLGGRHDALGCEGCHENAAAQHLAAGETRFRGLEQGCTHCHEDTHRGDFGPRCAECHGEERDFALVAAFVHDPRYPLLGAHARVTCRGCHGGEGGVGVAALLEGTRAEPARDSCRDCHASPHAPEFERTASADLGVDPRTACSECHRAVHETFRSERALRSPALHAATGFPLEEPHRGLACTSCHAGGASFADAFPGRGRDDCRACHGDPHEGQFDEGPSRGACLACHDRHAFSPASFGLAQHAEAGFPLAGAHGRAECAACHAATTAGEPRVFRGTPETCGACHSDPHAGQFADGPFAGGCGTCHGSDSFAPAAFGPELHRLAAFPLTGAHAAVACGACHAPEPGRVLAYRAAPTSCAGCHSDPHGGAFDGAGRPAAVGGRTGCARCHGTTSFAGLDAAVFDHDLWTGFPLEGAHARASCAECHPRVPAESGGAGRLGRAAGTRCSDCHADVHGGQLAVDGATDCARCHSVRAAFAADRFDHGDTRLPLDARHADLACAACHKRYDLGEGRSIVRYRPLGVRCIDCHDAETARRGGAR